MQMLLPIPLLLLPAVALMKTPRGLGLSAAVATMLTVGRANAAEQVVRIMLRAPAAAHIWPVPVPVFASVAVRQSPNLRVCVAGRAVLTMLQGPVVVHIWPVRVHGFVNPAVLPDPDARASATYRAVPGTNPGPAAIFVWLGPV